MIIQKCCNWVLNVALALSVASIGILASVPPVCRDSLTHHLYVPKLYLKAGCIHEISYIPFSYYPQILDLLYMVPLYFKNDIIPKYIHFAFAIATSFLIYSYLKNKFDKQAGLAGALFFLTIPVIVKLGVTVYVDLGLIFFTFASIIYLFKWKNSGLKWHYLILSGVFTGLAMGTKYNGLLTLILLTLLLPLLIPEHQITTQQKLMEQKQNSLEKFAKQQNKIFQCKTLKIFLYPFVFAITALLIFSPWMIRNYVWTGSPLYPLYQTIKIESPEHVKSSSNEIGENYIEQKSSMESEKNISMSHFLIRKLVYHEKWWETLSIPVRIFFQGEDDNPALFDGRLNPFLFIVPLLFVVLNLIDIKKAHIIDKGNFYFVDNSGQHLVDKDNPPSFNNDKKIMDREIMFLLLFSTLYLLLAFLKTDMRIRYVSPIIPPLVVVYVAGLYKIKEYLQIKLCNSKIKYEMPLVSESKCEIKLNNRGIEHDKSPFEHEKFKWRLIIITSIIHLLFFITLSFHIPYFKALFLQITPFEYISGKVSRNEYISRFRPEYEIIEYMNKTLPKDSKILALFLGDRGYYFDNEVRFGRELLFHAVKDGVNEAAISFNLKQNGFTHLIIGFELFNKSIQNNLIPEEQRKIKIFFDNQTSLITQNGFYGLYKLE